MCQVNNSVIFYGKPIGFEEFIIQKIEALDIIIDRRPEKRPKKKVYKWVSLLFLNIVRVGVLRKYETEKFSGSSLNRFIKAKNLVFLIPKISWMYFLAIFFFR